MPYVRKSFWKHYKDGLRYIEGLTEKDIADFEKELIKLEDTIDENVKQK